MTSKKIEYLGQVTKIILKKSWCDSNWSSQCIRQQKISFHKHFKWFTYLRKCLVRARVVPYFRYGNCRKLAPYVKSMMRWNCSPETGVDEKLSCAVNLEKEPLLYQRNIAKTSQPHIRIPAVTLLIIIPLIYIFHMHVFSKLSLFSKF